jgi:hypothetical protein
MCGARQHHIQRINVQRLLGHDLFQPRVLVLKQTHPTHFADFHPLEFRLPLDLEELNAKGEFSASFIVQAAVGTT